MTDEAIIGKVLSGNTHLYSEIVSRYKDKLYGMAYKIVGDYTEAQDVLQEAFINIYKSLHRYNGKCKVSTWIYRISYHTCIERKSGKS